MVFTRSLERQRVRCPCLCDRYQSLYVFARGDEEPPVDAERRRHTQIRLLENHALCNQEEKRSSQKLFFLAPVVPYCTKMQRQTQAAPWTMGPNHRKNPRLKFYQNFCEPNPILPSGSGGGGSGPKPQFSFLSRWLASVAVAPETLKLTIDWVKPNPRFRASNRTLDALPSE